jgi:hypothetical protein
MPWQEISARAGKVNQSTRVYFDFRGVLGVY